MDQPFEELARMAEALAETAERSAKIHEEMADYLPGAREHAERERSFASAERAAAAAYRNHEIPSEEIQQAIRDSTAARGPAGRGQAGPFHFRFAASVRVRIWTLAPSACCTQGIAYLG